MLISFEQKSQLVLCFRCEMRGHQNFRYSELIVIICFDFFLELRMKNVQWNEYINILLGFISTLHEIVFFTHFNVWFKHFIWHTANEMNMDIFIECMYHFWIEADRKAIFTPFLLDMRSHAGSWDEEKIK